MTASFARPPTQSDAETEAETAGAASRNRLDKVCRDFFAQPALSGLLREAVLPYRLDIKATAEGIKIVGDKPARLIAKRLLEKMSPQLLKGEPLSPQAVENCLYPVIKDALDRDLAKRLEGLLRPVRPMSFSQLAFLEDLLNPAKPLIFGIGPTGTGKSYLPIVTGLSLLAKGAIKHFIITKPHEMLDGEVITPSVRAEVKCDEQFAVFFDILHDLASHDEIESLLEQRKLEILPIGQVRGRTFNNAFILVDEAQNMNIRRMRMAVTRSGSKSRMVITGDPSQTELRTGERSGLAHLLGLVQNSDIASIHQFKAGQVIRNETVAQLEGLYAQEDPSFFVEVSASDPKADKDAVATRY